MAFLLDTVAVSLKSDSRWDKPLIRIRFLHYSELADSIVDSEESVHHLSRKEHLDALDDFLIFRKKRDIKSGKILWLKRRQLFPHLMISPTNRKRIESMRPHDPEFVQITKRLFELEEHCGQWDDTGFDPNRLPSKVSPESDTRLQTLEEKLTFLCEDGQNRLFSWHARYTPNAGRIYFFPDDKTKKMHIGYIGLKIF